MLGRRLIRLQCYEGIDASAALYEWNYPRQMLAIRQAGEESIDIYGETFLIERPMLAALRAPDSTVLLIDEIDRADQEFEAFLLEFLSDFQISIPERGTVRAAERPVVVLTSNRTRDLHEALRRRCVYHWIDYPDRRARGAHRDDAGLQRRRATARAVVAAVGKLRREPLSKAPGIAEAVDWAEAATLLHKRRRALAGRVQALDRRRAEGRGGPHLHLRPARRPDRGGGRVSDELQLPRAARVFVSFVALLRANGFAVAPEQTTAFLAAIELLGPRSSKHIRQAGLATLAPPPERRATYDRLFDIHFLGSEAIEHAGGGRRGGRSPAGGRPRRGRTAAGRRSQRIRAGRRARRGAGRTPLRGQARPAMRLRRLSREAPAAPAAAARPSPHARPPRPVCRSAPHACATASATTARCCGSAG